MQCRMHQHLYWTALCCTTVNIFMVPAVIAWHHCTFSPLPIAPTILHDAECYSSVRAGWIVVCTRDRSTPQYSVLSRG
eukprot:m.105539 g.105539  ORF g.105539 m.105539 type:complete len:78 (+) comp21028_c0_seq1:2327-2560(+)